MAKNKQSFGAASGFFNEEKNTREAGDRKPKKDVVDGLPEVQDENRVQKTIEMIKTAGDTLNSTQGRKGQKLPRINMAFTPENHEYIKRVSRQNGKSITEYINELISRDKNN